MNMNIFSKLSSRFLGFRSLKVRTIVEVIFENIPKSAKNGQNLPLLDKNFPIWDFPTDTTTHIS